MEALSGATSTLANVSQDVTGYVASVSIDIFIVLGLAAASMAVFLRWRKKRGLAILFSVLFTFLIFTFLPFEARLEELTDSAVQDTLALLAVFVVLAFLLYFFFKQVVSGVFSEHRGRRWFEAFLLSVSMAAAVLLVAYHAAPIEPLYDFGDPFDMLFLDPARIFWWVAGILAALYLATRPQP